MCDEKNWLLDDGDEQVEVLYYGQNHELFAVDSVYLKGMRKNVFVLALGQPSNKNF